MNRVSYFSRILGTIGLGLLGTTAAVAAPVNGTGFVSPNVIFGTGGNANGSFTGESVNGVEVGLRAKQRYPAANIFNYDGVDTYLFDSGILTTNPTNRSVFNFEWAVNVDTAGVGGRFLNDYDHLLSFDTDPGAGIAMIGIDPFATLGYFDHALGNNGTASNAGIESTDNADLLANAGIYNVAQQSSNLGFGFSVDPDAPGSYAFSYSVFAKGTTDVIATASINVNVLAPAPIPLPAGGLLLLSGLAGVAAMRRKKAV